MKTGDFVTTRTLLDKGFKFNSWLAGYHLYRKLTDESYTYLLHDFLKQEVITIFNSHQ